MTICHSLQVDLLVQSRFWWELSYESIRDIKFHSLQVNLNVIMCFIDFSDE